MSGTTRPKRATMSDIARVAGVSRTAVSLVLNDQDNRIPEATRQAIRDAARQLDYRPSVLARELRTQTSSMVGFVSDAIASGAFGGGLIAGAQEAVGQAGGVLLVLNTGMEGAFDDAPVEALHSRGVSSLIVATVLTRSLAIPPEFADYDIVLLNCYEPGGSQTSVLPDDEGGGYAAARHLLELGHREIAYLGGDLTSHPTRSRIEGAGRALKEWGIRGGLRAVVEGGWHGDAGYRGGRELITSNTPPTGILCGNDRVAFGVLDAAKELGLMIPNDLSVVGFDDEIEIAPYSHPALTTVRLPYDRMGLTAGTRIVERECNDGVILIECELIVRASTAAPPSTP